MLQTYFGIFVMTQVVSFTIIVCILKKALDGMLITLAVRHLELWARSKQIPPDATIIIISHKPIKKKYTNEIYRSIHKHIGEQCKPVFQINKKILGGVIIKVGSDALDCSLKDRLNQAFFRKRKKS